MTTSKRSSISEKAKDVIMEVFTKLFDMIIEHMDVMEIKPDAMTYWNECKDLDVYESEDDAFQNNPIRKVAQENIGKHGLCVESVLTTGNVHTSNIFGIFDQNVKVEAVIICMEDNGELNILGHQVLRVVRLRKC